MAYKIQTNRTPLEAGQTIVLTEIFPQEGGEPRPLGDIGINYQRGGTETFTVLSVTGEGASSIVYDVQREPAKTKARLKELYPAGREGVYAWLKRSGGVLVPDTDGRESKEWFLNQKHDFVQGFLLPEILRNKDKNLITWTVPEPRLYAGNGTLYQYMGFENGGTYLQCIEEDGQSESLQDILKTIDALAEVSDLIHFLGFVQLDIKPSNILILKKGPDASLREIVKLFDFDSFRQLVDIQNGKHIVITSTDGFAAPEVEAGRLDKIGIRSDIYSIGAVLFYRLTGRTPSNDERRHGCRYAVLDDCEYLKDYPPALKRHLRGFFGKTLQITMSERFDDCGALRKCLKELIEMADPKKQFLANGPVWWLSDKAIGREADLDKLHTILEKCNIAYIHGPGGVGKSELAKMYADRHKGDYDTIKFVMFSGSLKNTVAEIPVQNLDESQYLPVFNDGKPFRTDPDMQPPGSILQKADALYPIKLKVLRGQDARTLIVIDNFNVNGDDNLKDLQGMNCRFLFTTRNEQQNTKRITVSLQELEPGQTQKLFKSHCRPACPDETAIKSLLEAVGYNTLVLILAAKAIARNDVPIETLAQAFKGCSLTSVKGKVTHDIDYASGSERVVIEHLHIVFNLSSLSKEQKAVMAVMGLIPPSGILRKDFTEWSGSDIDDVNALIDSGWIQWDRGTNFLSLHPVIAALVVEDLNPGSGLCCKKYVHALKDELLRTMMIDVTCSNDKELNLALFFNETFENMTECAASSNYLEKLFLFLVDIITEMDIELAELCCAMGNIFIHYNNIAARDFYSKAIRIRLSSFGETHLSTAVAYSGFAAAAIYMSRVMRKTNLNTPLNKTLEYFEKAKIATEAVPDVLQPEKALVYDNFSLMYFEGNDYQIAIDWSEKALEIKKKAYGLNHPSTAVTYHNLGMIYGKCGEYQAAISWHEKALEIRKIVFGINHYTVALSCHYLALMYVKLKEYHTAINWYEKSLEIRKIVFDAHNAAQITYHNLAMLYKGINEYKTAINWYNKASESIINVFGANHLYAADIYWNLGITYEILKECRIAIDWHKKALTIYEKEVDNSTIYKQFMSRRIISDLYIDLSDYNNALNCLSKTSIPYLSESPLNHLSLADLSLYFSSIAECYFKLSNYKTSLFWSEAALKMINEALSEDTTHIMPQYMSIKTKILQINLTTIWLLRESVSVSKIRKKKQTKKTSKKRKVKNNIVLCDENGVDVNFLFLDLIKYNGGEYVVLLPYLDDADKSDDRLVVALKVEVVSDTKSETYNSIDDDAVVSAVYAIFKEKYKDVIDFLA